MRGSILVVGAIFLIIGFMVFWQGYSILQQYNTTLGQLALMLSEEARQEYQQAQTMTTIGGILALAGLVICIYGAAAKPKNQKTKPT